MEEGECEVKWYLNDTEIVEDNNISITFDGIYAKIVIVR